MLDSSTINNSKRIKTNLLSVGSRCLTSGIFTSLNTEAYLDSYSKSMIKYVIKYNIIKFHMFFLYSNLKTLFSFPGLHSCIVKYSLQWSDFIEKCRDILDFFYKSEVNARKPLLHLLFHQKNKYSFSLNGIYFNQILFTQLLKNINI